MVVITRWSDKADIRQIVGRDRSGGRKTATQWLHMKGVGEASTLMSKGLQGI